MHAATALALAVSLALAAASADVYPDKPIRPLVPYPPGGITGMLSRSVVELLRKDLGQPVLVDNRPGANTAIAAQALTTAAPDGCTVKTMSPSPTWRI